MSDEMGRQAIIFQCGASETDEDRFAGAGHSQTDSNYRLSDRMIFPSLSLKLTTRGMVPGR